jgi:hypothetical protein
MQRLHDPNANATGRDHDVSLRVRAEFTEMPGLRLTLPQASRLFNLERTQCERVLVTLVDMRILSMRGHTFVLDERSYVRAR